MDAIHLSPWYLNTRRIAVATGQTIGIDAQASLADNSGARREQMDYAARLAQSMVVSGRIPNLLEVVRSDQRPEERSLAAIWGVFTFKGVSAAYQAEQDGKAAKLAELRGDLAIGDTVYNARGTLYADHIYSVSSIGYLSGKRRVYIVGHFDFSLAEGTIDISPIIIGEFISEIHSDQSLRHRWPRHSRVYPQELHCFAEMERIRPPTLKQLETLKAMPECAVKDAFASIIGEPYVPNDWGGEKSDLYTSRMLFDGRPLSTAFLFKGPAVFRPMHPADLGKRGDQLIRLFEEPAELMVLQHCHKVMPTVIRQMEALAVQPARPRLYCVIDGADTYRILKRYDRLPPEPALARASQRQ